MKAKCFGSRRRVAGCQKEAVQAVGFGAKAKPYCGNDACKDAIVDYALEKSRKDKAKSDKDKHLARKKLLTESSIKEQKPLAQKAFNRYIRFYRYHTKGDRHCISCGRHESEIEDKGFGKFDCGHFQGVGAFPELRFCEDNVYLQCKSCNAGSGKYARKNQTVGVEYERRLREKVGDDLVDWLKGPHEAARLRASDYVDVKRKYSAMANEIQKNIV